LKYITRGNRRSRKWYRK